LAAASSDYRDLQEHIGSARAVLLIIALVYLVIGIVTFLAQNWTPAATPEVDAFARAAVVGSMLIAVAFLVCWQLALRAPVLAISIATLFWLGLQVEAAVVSPLSIGAGLWVKAVAAILLVRGIFASARAHAFLRKLKKAA
jgi:hypothetical protein